MKMTEIKSLSAMVAVSILLGLGFWWLSHLEKGTHDANTGRMALWPALQDNLDHIQRVELLSQQGKHRVTLARQEDGSFMVVERNYPADRNKLRDFLQGLVQAKQIGHRGAAPEFYAELGVDDLAKDPSSSVVRIHRAEGGMGLILGKPRSESAGNRQEQFVRFEADKHVRLIDRVTTFTPDPGMWLASELLQLPADAVRRVSIDKQDKTSATVIAHVDDVADFCWEDRDPALQSLDERERATAMGRWGSRLNIRDVWTGDAMLLGNAPAARITVELHDGKRIVAYQYPFHGKFWYRFETQEGMQDVLQPWQASWDAFKQRIEGRLFELTLAKHQAVQL